MAKPDGDGGELSQALLRQHLEAGAPAREQLITRIFIAVMLSGIGVAIVTSPAATRSKIVHTLPLLLPVIVHHVLVLLALRRGWYRPALQWLGMFLQTSVLVPVFVYAVADEGSSFLLTSAFPVGWASIVALSALRANPTLSIAAGVLAGVEYLGIFVFRPSDTLSSLDTSQVLLRAFFLALSGVVSGSIAAYLLGQAGAALRAIREQDLMGKYFLHERLGQGGMAEVYRATYSPEGGFEKTVAVKRVLPELSSSQQFTEMFREEARLCALLAHPNVVQVLDAGRFHDTYVLTMEYVDGISLGGALRRSGRALPLAATLHLGAELAAALDYIHRKTGLDGEALDLVHRDVNPPNILLSRFGEVKLADFGVAHAVSRTSLDPDAIYGKLGYIAPEQLLDQPIDGRADLFCLGLTLHEALTGARILPGKTIAETRAAIDRQVAAPSSCAPDVPAALDELIIELLKRDPLQRPATGGEVRARLLAIQAAQESLANGQNELAQFVRAALEAPDLEPPRSQSETAFARTEQSAPPTQPIKP